MKVRLCEHNDGSKRVMKAIAKQGSDVDVKRKDCLKECKRCKKGPFARIDGERVDADTTEELIRIIEERIAG